MSLSLLSVLAFAAPSCCNVRSVWNGCNGCVNSFAFCVVFFSQPALQDAVATIGPISVAIDASHLSLSFYSSGVYYEPACSNDAADLDHAVLAVGYGTEGTQDYWLVKNSWVRSIVSLPIPACLCVYT